MHLPKLGHNKSDNGQLCDGQECISALTALMELALGNETLGVVALAAAAALAYSSAMIDAEHALAALAFLARDNFALAT